jgi:tRNA(Ile)-lysidine synthase
MNIKVDLIKPGAKVIVALSGGADSVCLLHLLSGLRDKLGLSLEACHVNHMLRGEASDRDEDFVRELCSRLGIPLHVRRVDVNSLRQKHQSLEECAREARYSCFDEIGTNALVATAHTADDNTETVLFNLIRGTGLRGLCGIPPVRANFIRPLIETAKSDILAYLEERNVEYITDESNYSDEFTRNNLRLNVIPLLEKINPSLTGAVTKMCAALRYDEEYLHGIAASALESAGSGDGFYKADVLLNYPPAILNRIISLFLSQNNISPSNLLIKNIASLLESGGKLNLAKHKFAIVRDDLLCVETIHQNYRKK